MAQENAREAMIPALVHLYRAEVARADVWRVRLDSTTNWALTASVAAVSIGLSSPLSSHGVFVVAMGLVLNFLIIETRRYRTWDVYLRRVRLLETGFYTAILRGEPFDPDALREVASMLDAPRVVIPFWAALSLRVKRAYGAMLAVVLLTWLVKLLFEASQPGEAVERFPQILRIGFIPGIVVLILVCILYLGIGVAAVYGILSMPPATELLPARRRRRPLAELVKTRPNR